MTNKDPSNMMNFASQDKNMFIRKWNGEVSYKTDYILVISAQKWLGTRDSRWLVPGFG